MGVLSAQLPANRPRFFEQMDFVANHFWAARVVDGMMERDVVLWNTMVKAYVETGLEEGLYFFSAFHWSGLRLDDVSVHSVLCGID
ncbi:hypothetical protein ACFX2J_042539 [Malus domestica]